MWLLVSSLISVVGGFVINNVTQKPSVSIVNPLPNDTSSNLKYHIGLAIVGTGFLVWFLARRVK